MNKAFVREPDETAELHCPACGSLGIAVERETWQAHVKPEAAGGLAESAFFCPFPDATWSTSTCSSGASPSTTLAHGVYPKDPRCADLRLLWPDGRRRRGRRSRGRRDAASASCWPKPSRRHAHCRTVAPSGRTCVGDVQRYYMKLKGGPG